MEIILHTFIILELSWIANSFNVYEPARVPGWNYFGYSWTDQKPSYVFRKPMAAMVDLTNDLGVAILQDYSYSRSNFAFSPYGVASVLVVLYEGARGESARQIHRAVRFPWDKDITRIGFRDIHRHLRSYFSHEGYLSGITLSKDGSTLKPEYKRILRFYGYDVDVDSPERTSHGPPTTTAAPSSVADANATTPGITTTEGYDATTGKDPEETNITAASTITPEDITTSSSGEAVTTFTTMEDRESPVSPTTTIPDSSTVEEKVTTEASDSSGVATTEEQNEGNPATEQSNQEDTQQDIVQSTPEVNTEQSTQENNIQGNQENTQQGTEESTSGDNEQTTEENQGYGEEDDQQQSTEQSTEGNNVQDVEQVNPTVTEETTEQTNQEITEIVTEQSTLQENEADAQQIAEDVTQSTQLVTEQSTPGANVQNLEEDSSTVAEGDNQQSTEGEPSTQPNTEQSTLSANVQNLEEDSSTVAEGDKQSTETQPNAEQTTEVNKIQDPAGTEQNTEDTQQSSEESTPADPETVTEMTPAVTSTDPATEPMSDEPTTATTDEAEDFTISTTNNIEAELATMQDAEVVGNLTTEEGDRGSRSDALDNGMLIPEFTNGPYTYFDERLGLAYSNPDKRNLIDDVTKPESTSEYWKEIGVALIADGDEVKWEPKTLDEFLKSLMRENGESAHRTRRAEKLPGKSRLPVDVETSAKLRRTHSTKEKRNVSEFLKIPPVTDLSLQLQNGMFDSHVSRDADLYRVLPKFLFLVDGAIDTPVPMMTYLNVFPFAYIPRLHCKALEFPLDDERYKLLILLPVERRGLRQLIYDLGSYPLREVMDVLRPARVKAMVPTFMVEGFVILTPTLQKMGIWDVFDPRRADLSGMTSDPDLYVRNIEQSVTVVIRNYVEILDIQTRTMAARHIDEDFTASHPFLYFVMDTATNVALMAGQMLDPLNSRIY